MEIISHRGYWKTVEEKNTPLAFRRSFSLGFGTETDVRDLAGQLVISHDPPQGGELSLDAFLELARPEQPTLAINVKADGLARAIHQTLTRHAYKRWFVFDMSIPDTRAQLAAGNPTFVRWSDVEPTPAYLDVASGVWLDSFGADEWRVDVLKKLVADGVQVCVVSPELHQREHLKFWDALQASGLDRSDKVILCTDLPEAAVQFFQGAK